jgi:NAD/NADP transhydrogenase alpha subunit
LGALILLAIFLPNSSFAQMLAYPIIILGALAGIKFFMDSIRFSKTKNPLVRSFVIFGGLGVGAVIFIVCLIAGAIVGFAKDPNPQSTG